MKTALLVAAIFPLIISSLHAADKPGDIILKKLDDIVIPIIDFEDTSVEEAVDYLRVRSIELEKDEAPENRGVSVIIRKPRGKNSEGNGLEFLGDARNARIKKLQATNITLSDALIAICNQTGLDAYITTVGIILQPIGSELPTKFKGHKTEILKKLTPGPKPKQK